LCAYFISQEIPSHLDDWGLIPRRAMSRLALGPTEPPIQWVIGALSLGVKRLGVKLTLTST
jgi:hypothetical protein